MKKEKILRGIALTGVLFSVLTASAQLTVVESGQIQVGTLQKSNSGVPGSSSTVDLPVDNSARMVILGTGVTNRNGRISFGDSDHVLVGEDKGDNILALKGDNGLNFRMGNTAYFEIFKTTTLPVTTRAAFNCAVYADAFNTSSDLRLKTDVCPLGDRWSLLSGVNTISYRLLPRPVRGNMNSEESDSIEQPEPAIPDSRTRYGFAAQEVREIFPDLVTEDEDGFLSIDYLGFIPLLVDAYSNLAARNEELENKLEALMNPARKTAGVDGVLGESVTLSQNRPNPFTESTVIDITLSSDITTAMLCVYDMQGKQVMQLPVEGRGNTSVVIDGAKLSAGMYLYSLIADGQEVATKRMILKE